MRRKTGFTGCPARHLWKSTTMHVEPTKLTDTLERQLGELEIEAQRGAAFAGDPGTGPLHRLIRIAGRAAGTIQFLRSQAKRAKIDYVAG
jgi:hypothetical protein